jgi:RNA polymerase sigma factor for flagellar operon FliA
MSVLAQYATTQAGDLNALIVQYAPLVKRIAYHLSGRLPASIQVGDLIQAGMIGLMEAARHYDASQGASFETYAGIRVRGAMLDEVRKSDWAPRSVYRMAREITRAIARVENTKGGVAKDHDVAEAMGLPIAEYHQALQDVSGHRVLSFEDIAFDEEDLPSDRAEKDDDPSAAMQGEETKRDLASAIGFLPERERLVLALYYHEEMNLRAIGQVLDITESRVCQIHSQALLRLRARLSNRKSEKSDEGQM